jgi:hypothetical protein
MTQLPVNHYVVFQGDVASEVSSVLNRWLNEISAQSLTEDIWVYSAIEDERTVDVFDRLRNMSPAKDWKPFRILFLRPHGNGCFAYKMPSASISGDGRLGAGSFGF